MGSHSQSLLFFIVDTSYSCVICSKFFMVSTIKNNHDCEQDPMILMSYIICTSIFKFYKYWPDDGLVRPKLTATI